MTRPPHISTASSHCGFNCYLYGLCRFDSVRQVVKAGRADESSNLLLVSGSEVALIDGKNLQLLWRFNTSSVLRYVLNMLY